MMCTQTFDATAWLSDFKTVGGTFSTLPDGDWFIGWRLDPHLNDDDARSLFNEVKDSPDRLEAVKMAVEHGWAR